jgi:hypothetical protein
LPSAVTATRAAAERAEPPGRSASASRRRDWLTRAALPPAPPCRDRPPVL